MQIGPSNGDGILVRIFETASGAILGALITLVTFRTRLALLDRELADTKRELKELREETDVRHDQNRRGQNMLLEIVAAIARKVGVDHRFSDTLVRFLGENGEA